MIRTASKKTLLALVAALAALAIATLALAGCGSSSSSDSNDTDSEDKTITVAASPTPHAEILTNAVAPVLEEQGYTLVVKEFTDYVQPNTVTEAGEVDANYFQHTPYLENFNEEQGTHLVSVAKVHVEPMGVYSKSLSSIDELADGANVAVPNDATNEARALLLLEEAGLIELADDAGIAATPNDITSNPKNLKFTEVEAANVANIVEDVDIAVINGNYAIAAGFSVSQDALVSESDESVGAQTYANVVVCEDGNQDSDKIQALVEAVNSDEVREYIESTYADGSVIPVF